METPYSQGTEDACDKLMIVWQLSNLSILLRYFYDSLVALLVFSVMLVIQILLRIVFLVSDLYRHQTINSGRKLGAIILRMRLFAFLLVFTLVTGCDSANQIHIGKADIIVIPKSLTDKNPSITETRLLTISLLNCEHKLLHLSPYSMVLRIDNNANSDIFVSKALFPKLKLKVGQAYVISLLIDELQVASSVLNEVAVELELTCE